MNIRIIITLCIFPLWLNSQVYKTDISAVINHMTVLKNYSMKIHYKLYIESNLNKPFQEKSTQIQRNRNNLYCKRSDGIEFLSTRNFDLSVDSHSKIIIAKQKTKEEEKSEPIKENIASDLDLDLFLGAYDKIDVKVNTAKKITYELFLKSKNPIERMLVVINKEKNVLESVRYTYRDPIEIPELGNTKHRVVFEMNYDEFILNPSNNQSCFNESRFIASSNGKIKTVSQYKGYKLNLIN